MTEEQTNGIDSTSAKRFVGEILASWKRTREIREEAKEKIKPDLEDQVEHREGLYEAAESAGLPLLALKLEVGRQKLDWENEIKKKAREEKAGTDTVDLADMIKEVLGEDFAGLPLGEAAVKAATQSAKEPKKKRTRKAKGAPLVGDDDGAAPKTGADDEADLRSTRQPEKEAARKAETEERLAGMKTLNETLA